MFRPYIPTVYLHVAVVGITLITEKHNGKLRLFISVDVYYV